MPGQRETQATRREQILEAAYEVALRRGIDGLTVRAVAIRARLSHSLVLFHFKRKEQLGLALLDRVLAGTLSITLPNEIRTIRQPRERLQVLVRQELQRLAEEPRRLRLLLEFWTGAATTPSSARRSVPVWIDTGAHSRNSSRSFPTGMAAGARLVWQRWRSA